MYYSDRFIRNHVTSIAARTETKDFAINVITGEGINQNSNMDAVAADRSKQLFRLNCIPN